MKKWKSIRKGVFYIYPIKKMEEGYRNFNDKEFKE